MSSRPPYRRHSPEFKLQICQEIRSGDLRRQDAQQKYKLSAALVHTWLTRFDRADPEMQEPDPVLVAKYEAKIAALERKVGQLTMEVDLLKKTPRLRLVSGSENSSIISGPKAAPSADGCEMIESCRAVPTTTAAAPSPTGSVMSDWSS